MIRGKQAVLEYFEQINAGGEKNIFFSIYNKGQENSGNPCIKTPDKEGWNYQQAYEYLNRWLSFQQYGDFILIVHDRPKTSERGGYRQLFSISLQDNMQAAPAINGPVFNAEDISRQVNEKVQAALAEEKRKQELETLKKQVTELSREKRELEKRANDPWTKLIAGIEPYIPHILQEQGIIKKAVAGVPQSNATPVQEKTDTAENDNQDTVSDEVDPELQARMETVVKKFSTARPDDWLQILETLADALERKPGLGDKIKFINML